MMRNAGMLLLVLAAGIASGQDAGVDPPSRVARLNYIQGQVSFRPGSVEEWTNATLNYPLYNGDHLWAEMGAQTELHVGSTAIRMGGETALAILNLDDRLVQLSLTGGILNVHLRALGNGESFEVDTPNAAITLLRPGDYRFQVDENSNLTVVNVHGGDAEVTAGGRSFVLHPRDSARLTGMDNSLSSEVTIGVGFDRFDQWCQDRDRREEQSQSVRYVGRETIGYEDLDDNGAWSESPEYGPVWRPRTVAAGWAPYRYGRWAWVEPWGWTWVDDAPWGFAPFHYGRWAMWGGGWVWVPGRVVARPVYAPALVAFVGGDHFRMTVGFGGGGGVAWFPLGPHEVYRPAYRTSEVYVRQVNVTHVNVTNINVTNVRYVNQNVNGAVTAVPHDAFVGSRSVHSAHIAVSANAMTQVQVMGNAGVAPERVSVLGRPGGAGNVAAPPARVTGRPVYFKTTPPPPPVSFGAKREALHSNPGRPLDPASNDSLRRVERVQRPAMQQQTPQQQAPQQQQPVVVRPDRPVYQRPQEQQQQQRQVQQPQVHQPQVQQPQVQQPVPRPRPVDRPMTQQAPPQPARTEPRQEVRTERKEEHKQEQQHRTDRKSERKEEKKQQ